ncbi:MAG TPA: M28 family peptidase, partial [Candidatus Coprenecus pullistercoris]|nr:M28 family peptidase [Candidatus Coprenecus pullistercoris]
AARFIEVLYRQYGLEPLFGGSFYQPFIADSLSGTCGRNVVGIVRSAVPSDEYVLISAHYDHLGILNGNVYNGADDNASGVTVLLNLADMLGTMKKTRTGPDKNIIFAALDAKELNMAGSKALVDKLVRKEPGETGRHPSSKTAPDSTKSATSNPAFQGIPRNSIICAINIDQIGTVIEPVHETDTSFVIVLGEQTLRRQDRGLIDMCNRYYHLGLDIDYTFYGSENFTRLFYQLSDQIVFHEAGIPALVFTSGFHRHTYKTTDDPDIISYPIMKKRTLLIFYLTMML